MGFGFDSMPTKPFYLANLASQMGQTDMNPQTVLNFISCGQEEGAAVTVQCSVMGMNCMI